MILKCFPFSLTLSIILLKYLSIMLCIQADQKRQLFSPTESTYFTSLIIVLVPKWVHFRLLLRSSNNQFWRNYFLLIFVSKSDFLSDKISSNPEVNPECLRSRFATSSDVPTLTRNNSVLTLVTCTAENVLYYELLREGSQFWLVKENSLL